MNNKYLSWSKKLFFWINGFVGKYVWLDRLAIFGARWMIFVYIFCVLIYIKFFLSSELSFIFFAGSIFLTVFGALSVSYFIGFIWPHSRPQVEYPKAKHLITLKEFELWKSFPSDHTLISMLLAFIILNSEYLASSPWSWLFLIFAVYIASSRIIVGVHYPRDIIGGTILAYFFSYYFTSILHFIFPLLSV